MQTDPTVDHLTAGGVEAATAAAWVADLPEVTGDFERDRDAHGAFWSAGIDLVHTLGEPADRSPATATAARAVHELSRRAKRAFLAEHRAALYRAMTDDFRRFVRVEDAIYACAELVPGLVPSRALVAEDDPRRLKHKEGWEYDQGVLLSSLFDWEPSGRHLLHAMLLPTADALARLDAHLATGITELDKATVQRRGRASVVTLRNEPPCPRSRPPSTWPCSTRPRRSVCCRAPPSTIPSTPASGCSAAGST
jgi:(3,5-dihydroxyphenyl)acetyl-CoA 1,2-dioxygenase